MQLKDFIAAMERIAPPELAMPGDNVGLLVGPDHTEIRRVLVALDCSVAVAREAVACKADLVLTHHPLFFHPIQRFLPDDPETASAYVLARNGVGLYAAHTNLDTAVGGVNDALSAKLGLTCVVPFGDGMGRIGALSRETTLGAFAQQAGKLLHARISLCGDAGATIKRVAVLGGAGADALSDAKAAGADVLVTGEAKHHMGYVPEVVGIPMIVAGHYETEKVVLEPLIARLQSVADDVQYQLACSDASPFVQV